MKKFKDTIQEINEAIMSNALLSALNKNVDKERIAAVCEKCNYNIPIYKGRYGKFCPQCGNELKFQNEAQGHIEQKNGQLNDVPNDAILNKRKESIPTKK